MGVRRRGKWAAGVTLVALALGVVGLAPAYAVPVDGYLDITVQDSAGDPLVGASVQVFPANQTLPDPVNDPDWHPAAIGSSQSGADGVAHFVLPVDEATTLQVNVLVEKPGYTGRWYNSSDNYANANDLFVSGGGTETATQAIHQKLRIVTVYTSDIESGLDLPFTTVGLYDVTGDGSTPALTVKTNALGAATLKLAAGDLPLGTYRARGSHVGYLDQWFTVAVNDFANATDILLDSETGAESIDIALPAGARGPFTTAPKPTISGKARKGKTLTCRTGTWAPRPSAYAFSWYRGAKKIAGATAKSYTLRKADIGKRISVKVKASGPGLITTTRTSAKTVAVKR